MTYYASLSSAPSAYPHVSYTSYLHSEDVNNSTDARFSTDDRSLSGDGIPNPNARRTDLMTEVKDIKTDLKDIKTEVKNMVYVFQAIQEEKALQTRQRTDVINGVISCANSFMIGIYIGYALLLGGLLIYFFYG